MGRSDRVLPRLDLRFPLGGQSVEDPFLKEIVDGRLALSGALDEAEEQKPVQVPAEAGIVWPLERLLADLDPLLVQALYLLVEGAIDIGAAPFAVGFEIPFDKETGTVLAGAPAPWHRPVEGRSGTLAGLSISTHPGFPFERARCPHLLRSPTACCTRT